MSQIMTLCGIQPEQTDIDFRRRGLDAADAKLLAFDLSKNRTVKAVRYPSFSNLHALFDAPPSPVNVNPSAVCSRTPSVPRVGPHSLRVSRAIRR